MRLLFWIGRTIIRFFDWWEEQTEDICPVCGYGCTGRFRDCLPPKVNK